MIRNGIQTHAGTRSTRGVIEATAPRRLTVLITAATGNQGGAVARRLLQRGHEVRALSRSGDSPAARELERLGAKVWTGDFDDRDSLERAAAGASAVFAMVPYEAGMEVELRQASNLFAAAKAAGVGHVVYSSAAGADRQTGLPPYESKAAVERRLAGLGIPYTIVAPVAFMENAFLPWTLPGLQQGTLALALPESRPLQHVALADLASFVALVVEERERFLGRRIDLASDEVMGAEQAKILSQATGRKIGYVELPLEQVRSFSEELALLWAWADEVGHNVDIEQLRRDYPEVGWHTFAEWAASQDWSVLDGEAAA
jgi:uncharacterized protein YbjT (DUF2867 family)